MITLTPPAAAQILASARQADLPDACLRLAARLADDGAIEYGMGFDAKSDGDVEVVIGDVKLLVANGCVELLTGATLDYVELNPGEFRFIFVNPNDPSHKPPRPVR